MINNHLEYYSYQAEARQIRSAADVEDVATQKSYIYDRIVLPKLGSKDQFVVEAACGHGSFLCWLRNRGFSNSLGIDSSPEQIALARSAELRVEIEDVGEWLKMQPDETVNKIVGIDLIEHLSKDAFVGFLSGCQRVLRKDGHLILRYPNGDSPLVGLNLFNDITHIWTYTSTAMRSVSAMCGFADAEFVDESAAAIRDMRWIKVPLCRITQKFLGILLQAATREKVTSWSPHTWVFLEKK